jgi:hypothetical protein
MARPDGTEITPRAAHTTGHDLITNPADGVVCLPEDDLCLPEDDLDGADGALAHPEDEVAVVQQVGGGGRGVL